MENNVSKFSYSKSTVTGEENVLIISFSEDGKNYSVPVLTFSDAQFELIDRAKIRAKELRLQNN